MEKIIAVMMISLFLQCCQNKSLIKSSYTSMRSNTFKDEIDSVDLFFEGIKIDRDYEQIGFVEAGGDETSTTEELLNSLKYRAYQNGADAVINIKKEMTISKTGYLSDDKSINIYSAPSFNGIAIKFLDNQAGYQKTERDTTFVHPVHDNIKKEQLRNSSVVAVFLAVVVTMIAVQ